ncbi:MAG: hypothetical protein AAGI08_13360 [Bacteroidota bacterium]
MRLLCLLAVLSFVTAASGQTVPAQISYQGYLELSGSPVSGAVDLGFSLYTQATGGTAVWTETQTSVPVDAGVYQVALGSVTALPADTFDVALWLGVRINGEAELTPRTALLPAPYALGLRLPLEAVSDGDGIVIKRAGNPSSVVDEDNRFNGFEVAGAEDTGLSVGRADVYGVLIRSSGFGGVLVESAGNPTFAFSDGNANGFAINAASGSGLFVGRANVHGVRVRSAGMDGVRVVDADMDGIRVENAGQYGAYIQNTPGTSNGNLTTAYVGLFENKSSNVSADGLAIKIGTTGNPGGAANFMGFFDGDDDLVGQIDGNGAGGVQYKTTGADYAEYLTIAGCSSSACGLEAGTVVGVEAGTVSLTTEGADEVLVVSTRPAVVGNAPQGESTDGFAAIAMLGQAEVRVTGSVDAGDYVLASGRGDGTAVAVPASEIRVDMLERLIGRAWSAKSRAGEGTVNVAVGLDRTEVLTGIIRRQQREIDELRQMIEALAAR